MTTDDPVLDKVRKLLAKAEATRNEHEAEAFAAKAAELIAAHRIDVSRLARADGEVVALREVPVGPRRLRAGPPGAARRRRRGPRLRDRLAHRPRRAPSASSPASRPTSTPRPSSTSRCTCRRRAGWLPCAGPRRRRRSAGGGRSCSATPTASASCSARPAGGSRPTPAGGAAARRPCPTCPGRAAQVRAFAATAFGRVTTASAPAPAAADGYHHGHAAASSADIGRSRLAGRRSSARAVSGVVERADRAGASSRCRRGRCRRRAGARRTPPRRPPSAAPTLDGPAADRRRCVDGAADAARRGSGGGRPADHPSPSRRPRRDCVLVGARDAWRRPSVEIRVAAGQCTSATLAHELAHALAGVDHGHDAVFRAAHVDVVRRAGRPARRRCAARPRTSTSASRRRAGAWPSPVRVTGDGFAVVP